MAKKLKQKNPLVSVILPAYNEEDHIAECIESLLRQSYKPIEIFIVDDESKDKTAEIVKKYKKVRLLQQKHSGPGAAWNLGFRHAKGEILMFWASDHVYGKNYIKDLAEPIIKGKALRTVHAREEVANFDNIWAKAWGARDWRKLLKPERTSASLTSRKLYLQSGGFDPKLGYADDQSIYKRTKVIAKVIDTPVSHYNPDSAKESFAQAVWVGAAYKKPFLILLSLPLFPAYVLFKSIKHLSKDFHPQFILFLPVFYTVKYFGHYIGALRKVFFKKNTRL